MRYVEILWVCWYREEWWFLNFHVSVIWEAMNLPSQCVASCRCDSVVRKLYLHAWVYCQLKCSIWVVERVKCKWHWLILTSCAENSNLAEIFKFVLTCIAKLEGKLDSWTCQVCALGAHKLVWSEAHLTTVLPNWRLIQYLHIYRCKSAKETLHEQKDVGDLRRLNQVHCDLVSCPRIQVEFHARVNWASLGTKQVLKILICSHSNNWRSPTDCRCNRGFLKCEYLWELQSACSGWIGKYEVLACAWTLNDSNHVAWMTQSVERRVARWISICASIANVNWQRGLVSACDVSRQYCVDSLWRAHVDLDVLSINASIRREVCVEVEIYHGWWQITNVGQREGHGHTRL